jgi:RES domain-containing protein
MMLVALHALAYRVHVPKWAFAPTSGAGAARNGGRANRPGVNALYLSLDLETALTEYRQIDLLMPPGLMVCYRLDVDPVVDFRAGADANPEFVWGDFYCDWRAMYFNRGIEPPSWPIGDRVLAAGAKGIIFCSALTPGANVVLFNDALGPGDSLTVHDPDHALPKNQASWE